MLRFKKGSKGFTLMELMVVVAILTVLMAVVVPAVTGTKSVSLEGQVKSDAKSVQTATDNFNNKSINTGKFPEDALSATHTTYGDVFSVGKAGAAVPGTADGSKVKLILTGQAAWVDQTLATTITKPGTSTTVAKRTALKFNDTTNVYDASGAVKSSTFVPDFLLKEPSSLILKGDETAATLGTADNTFEEFLWLMLVNAPGADAESRTVQVFRMTAATCAAALCQAATDVLTYTQIF